MQEMAAKHARGSEVPATASVRESQEKSSKAVEVSGGAPSLLRRLSSRPAPSQAHAHTKPQALFSLKGLVATQKFSKALKERIALKIAVRNIPARKPIVIVNEQVPAGSAQPAKKFPCGLVHQMLQDFLSSRLEAVGYSAPSCGGLVKALSEEVKALVRTVCPDRYRLVCTVALGQLGPEGQQGYGGLVLASRSLWDPHTDTCVAHTYRSQEIFCTANVFAVYFE
nr:tctex1 domain-containing protein 1-B-like [Salvelinus alpinus]